MRGQSLLTVPSLYFDIKSTPILVHINHFTFEILYASISIQVLPTPED